MCSRETFIIYQRKITAQLTSSSSGNDCYACLVGGSFDIAPLLFYCWQSSIMAYQVFQHSAAEISIIAKRIKIPQLRCNIDCVQWLKERLLSLHHLSVRCIIIECVCTPDFLCDKCAANPLPPHHHVTGRRYYLKCSPRSHTFRRLFLVKLWSGVQLLSHCAGHTLSHRFILDNRPLLCRVYHLV